VSTGLRASNTEEAIRSALKKKAGRYGTMDRPYVVAVNVLGLAVGEIDYKNALFGNELFVDTETAAGYDSAWIREGNGFWRGEKGPRNRRVSAVAFFETLDPWSAAKRPAVVMHNPWAEHPLPDGLLGTPEKRWSDGKVQGIEGLPLHSLLDLPPDWPVAGDDTE
jgi:hypothetical protein